MANGVVRLLVRRDVFRVHVRPFTVGLTRNGRTIIGGPVLLGLSVGKAKRKVTVCVIRSKAKKEEILVAKIEARIGQGAFGQACNVSNVKRRKATRIVYRRVDKEVEEGKREVFKMEGRKA